MKPLRTHLKEIIIAGRKLVYSGTGLYFFLFLFLALDLNMGKIELEGEMKAVAQRLREEASSDMFTLNPLAIKTMTISANIQNVKALYCDPISNINVKCR